jgi:hypothetical protein
MPGLADPHTSRAVLIGSAHYQYLPDLPAVANNVAKLAEILMNEDIWGLPHQRCHAITDERDPARIGRVLRVASMPGSPRRCPSQESTALRSCPP